MHERLGALERDEVMPPQFLVKHDDPNPYFKQKVAKAAKKARRKGDSDDDDDYHQTGT